MKRKNTLFWTVGLGLILLHSYFPGQIDFTADQRYTLSPTAINTLEATTTPLRVDVFLSGDLPNNFQRLRQETQTLLEQMARKRPLLLNYINPFEGSDNVTAIVEEMLQYGLQPHNVVNANTQRMEQTVVFPWAIVSDGSRSVRVSLLKKTLSDSPEQQLLRSIRQLEYQFTDAIIQLQTTTKKSIAVLTSHNTSSAASTADLLQSLKPYYNLAAFDLKALQNDPITTINNLKRFDVLFISNPKAPFTATEKLVLDQYQMHGGASLWAINTIQINRDSLFNSSGSALAYPNPLNLEDYFFKRGLRLNNNLVKDLYAAPIVLAQGSGNQSQYLPYPWSYYPLVPATTSHPIAAGVGNVWLRFTSSIDTLKNAAKKQFLLTSSPLSKAATAPFIVRLEEATQAPNPEAYNQGSLGTAVLLEGAFESLYKNRVLNVDSLPFKANGNAKMLVIADGNIAENQLDKGQPVELGYDKWTNNFYNNKTFLQNAFHYLMGEEARIALRAKTLQVALLDLQRTKENSTLVRLFVALIPLLFLGVLIVFTRFWRMRMLR
ncbi:MAG: gliding motility-associated ABC transporter substrate-binding protein GldG [Flavobacteriales bacterium]